MINKKEPKKKNKVIPVIVLLTFATLSSFALYFFKENYVPVVVYGTSMSPTLKEEMSLIVYKTDSFENGDIVSFSSPDTLDEYYVKRVIGVAGDTVEYKEDVLYINGEPVAEPYLDDMKSSTFFKKLDSKLTQNFNIKTLDATKAEKVPEGYLFVLGDNRIESKDSRFFGFVDIEKVIGKVVFPSID